MKGDAFDILKPFAWLAAVAFLTGFASYLALAPSPPAAAHTAAHPASAIADVVSGPASDDWNFEKHV